MVDQDHGSRKALVQRNRDVAAGFQDLKDVLVPSTLSFPTMGPSAMFFPLLAFSSHLHFIDPVSAQVYAPNCTDSNYTWSLNTLHQSPCLVAAHLEAVCNDGAFTILPLRNQELYFYQGPDGSDKCTCNAVVYNLFSACGACQGGGWLPYADWIRNCIPDVFQVSGTFPEPVPDGTRVPQWAYIDTADGVWNSLTAKAKGGAIGGPLCSLYTYMFILSSRSWTAATRACSRGLWPTTSWIPSVPTRPRQLRRMPCSTSAERRHRSCLSMCSTRGQVRATCMRASISKSLGSVSPMGRRAHDNRWARCL